MKSDDPDTFIKQFTENLDKLYRNNFPLKIKFVSKNRIGKPWITANIRKLIKAKSTYFHLFKLKIVSETENKTFRNKVQKILKTAKNQYYRRLFEENMSNPQKTWKNIKNLCGSNTVRSLDKITLNNVDYYDNAGIAHALNEHFSETALNLDSNLPQSTIDPLSYVVPQNLPIFTLTPFTLDECSSIISKLKITKTDIDSVSVRIFKKYSSYFSSVIVDFVNLCFQKSYFPLIFKSSLIIAIFKKGDPHDPSNFRPISLLFFISKILERAIFNRTSQFCLENSIITPSQFGFTKGKSVQDALINLTEFIYNSLNSKQFCITVQVDYQKAFDTVKHDILLSKLEKYGIGGGPLQLFKSFLTDRTQAVKYLDAVSSRKSISIGIPQGTVLGPLLFLLYVNDMPNFSNDSAITLFADDTTLCFRGPNYHELVDSTCSRLSQFISWSESNRLSVHPDKTSCMIFSNRYADFSLPIQMNQKILKIDESATILGMQLDNKLKFNNHITVTCKKISKNLGLIYRIRDSLPYSTLRTLYYGLLYPYFLYCICIWGGTFSNHLRPLIILQKRAVRIINKSSYLAHSTPLFLGSRILKLKDIYTYNLALYMFDHHADPEYRISHNFNTRNQTTNVNVPFERLTLTQHSVKHSASKVWNDLPDSLKNLDSREVFCKNLKNLIFEGYRPNMSL